MSFTSTLTSKNQTTIPKAIVEALKIKPRAILVYDLEPDGSVRITAKTATFRELAGSFGEPHRGEHVSDSEMREAVRQGAVKSYQRSVQ